MQLSILSDYEQARYRSFLATHEPLRHLFAGRDVLDFGAGWGLAILAIRALGGVRVCGVEPVGERVRRGREILAAAGYDPEQLLHVEDTTQLPLPDNAFGAIFATAVLEHIPQPRTPFLREIWRVLRPGGRLIISETPNKYLPWDYHTTHLPLIPWLPSRVAHAIATKLGRIGWIQDTWETCGWRGLGHWELVSALGSYVHEAEMTRPRHRLLAAIGLPTGLVDPFPLWILRKVR